MSSTVASVAAAHVTAARTESSETFGQALERCRRYLLDVAHRAIGPGLRGKGGASDLVQDTFLEAQQLALRYAGGTDVQMRAWLRCLLLHKAAKLGRRFHGTRKRQLSREVPLDGASAAAHSTQFAARIPTPSVQLMADEQEQRLREAIDRLPADYRRVVDLRYQEGLTFDEVGRRLERSADAARMLWARAVERLKLELRGDGPCR